MMIAIFALAALEANDNTWLEILLSTSLKGVLILIIAAALSFALRKASAASRHLVWSLAIASLLALPVLSFGLPSWQVPVLPFEFSAGQSEIAAITPAMNRSQMQPPEPVAVVNHQSPLRERKPATSQVRWPMMSVSSEQASTVKAESFGWTMWALIIWLAGAALIFARLIVGIASVWWVVRRAEKINEDVWLNLANRLAHRVGLTRQVVLLKSNGVSMPLTCGVMRSVILLPADADDWPDERRHVVLLHELAHVKRRDCLTQMLAQVACAIYWFNPLTWAAARQLRMERERACDDQVLDAGTKASDYADHLLDIARRLRSRNCSSLASVAIARRSQLEGRLLAILDPSVSRRGLSRIGSVAVALIVACIILPLASLRPSAHTQARSSERADASAPAAIKSFNRSVSESPSRIAPAQTAPQAEVIEIAPPDAPPLIEIETPELQPANIDPQPSAAQAQTPASQQEKDSAVAALVEALKDEDAEVRENALFALSQIGGAVATEALMAALKDSSPQVREKAVWALGMRPGAGHVDELINALRDSNAQVRDKAAWALGMVGNQSAIEPLTNALRDEDGEVRQKAAWALGMRGNSRAVEPLINALKDSLPDVRGMAAWALGMKGDKSAIKALNAAMKDGNKDVRQKAAWALGMMLMKNGESLSDDNDNDLDVDVDVDADVDNDDDDDDDHIGSGSGSGAGSGTGVGKGKGSGKGSGKGKAKHKAKPE
jgi:HEAT repeat protein/beta-lactamase regulating signal transducer with metallopeptidase domain